SHGHRTAAGAAATITKVASEVVAPATRCTIVQNCTGVLATSRNCNHVRQTNDVYRHVTIIVATVAKLPRVIVAPAFDGTHVGNRAAVEVAGCDGAGTGRSTATSQHAGVTACTKHDDRQQDEEGTASALR